MQPLARSAFQSWRDGARTDLHTLRGRGGLEVAVCTWGARLVRVAVPDGPTDVVLGYDSLAGYLQGQPSMGAFIGRWAGRLRHGRLTLPDGTWRQLALQGGPHAVHGGARGCRFRTFQVDDVQADALQLSLVFQPEDDGVPGSLRLQLRYQVLPDNALRIAWHAQAGGDATLAQFTAHPFFNLAGHGSALDHVVQVPADHYVPLAADACPLGTLAGVDGTPLDFRTPRTPRAALQAAQPQWQAARGLDHCLVLAAPPPVPGALRQAARLHCPRSGRTLTVHTSEPALQVYAGHGLGGPAPRDLGRGGWHWQPGDALCLEPMSWPDAPNQPAFPDPWLPAGAVRQGEILYRFGEAFA